MRRRLLRRSYRSEGVEGISFVAALASFLDTSLIAIQSFDMSPQLDGKSFLDDSANRKAALAMTRRSFVAGWKLCAVVALGLCVRSSWARAAAPAPVPKPGPCSRDWLWHPSDYRFESATAAINWDRDAAINWGREPYFSPTVQAEREGDHLP